MGVGVEFNVNEKCKLRADANDMKQAFQFIATAQTVFGVDRCGHCESTNLRLKYTTPQGYEYYSVQCQDCRYELKFGIRQEDKQLFPKGWEEPYQGGDAKKDEPKKSKPREESREAEPASTSKTPW